MQIFGWQKVKSQVPVGFATKNAIHNSGQTTDSCLAIVDSVNVMLSYVKLASLDDFSAVKHPIY
jgi:hypothetical protein